MFIAYALAAFLAAGLIYRAFFSETHPKPSPSSIAPATKYNPPPAEYCPKCNRILSSDNKKHACAICENSGCDGCIEFADWPEHPIWQICINCINCAKNIDYFPETYQGDPGVFGCSRSGIESGYYKNKDNALLVLKLQALKKNYNILVNVKEEWKTQGSDYIYKIWQYRGIPCKRRRL